MLSLIDSVFPWFGDMLELGGNILLAIIVLALVIWTFLLERVGFLLWAWPAQRDRALALWRERPDRGEWYSRHFRGLLVARLKRSLTRNTDLTRTLIKLSPLLGLLGTVLGMLEVFDAVAATGSNNPRSTASGVSKATVTTMAGMVVAIAGLLVSSLVERRLAAESNKLNELMDTAAAQPAPSTQEA
ncbi:MAG: MotA/TolQ/ExbB proton channel family protein [Halioglobus sp.]|nr:MotA/TolQ/ExbB proton channel family protein [Halioglobus sp.]